MIPAGSYQRGETVSFIVSVTVGDISTVIGLPTATLKPLASGAFVAPGANIAPVGQFSVVPFIAQSGIAAGWTITLSGTQTAALPAGRYVTDCRLLVAGSILVTDPLTFLLVEAVTTS
jgi:hypothetical protein